MNPHEDITLEAHMQQKIVTKIDGQDRTYKLENLTGNQVCMISLCISA